MGVARRLGGWAGMKAARRLATTVPVVGALLAVVVVSRAVRRKGWTYGLLDTALDALPVVGAVKAGVELFRGEIFPERPAAVSTVS